MKKPMANIEEQEEEVKSFLHNDKKQPARAPPICDATWWLF